MSKKIEKQLNQLIDVFGLSTDVVVKQIEDLKEFYAKFHDQFTADDEQAYKIQLDMLNNELQNEADYPLAQQVLDTLNEKLGEAKVTKILNMITSDDYSDFFKIVDDVLLEHTEKSIELIDEAIAFEEQKKSNKLH